MQAQANVNKINATQAQPGPQGQKQLSGGKSLSMRLWENEAPSNEVDISTRDYETVGFVLSGRAELQIGGETVSLQTGDSWTVPAGVKHGYKIIESFTAIEAISPAAR